MYVYGLFLDGCAWSGRENKLVDLEPKKLYHPLPVLYVTGVQAKVRHHVQGYGCAFCRMRHAHNKAADEPADEENQSPYLLLMHCAG